MHGWPRQGNQRKQRKQWKKRKQIVRETQANDTHDNQLMPEREPTESGKERTKEGKNALKGGHKRTIKSCT